MFLIGVFYAVGMLYVAVQAYRMAKKAAKASSAPTPEDVESPKAEKGVTIPIVFGTQWIGQNIVWYGDQAQTPIKKKQGKK